MVRFTKRFSQEQEKQMYYDGLGFGLNEIREFNEETGNEMATTEFPFGVRGETLHAPAFKVRRFQLGIFSGLIWDVEDDWNYAEVAFDVEPSDYLMVRDAVRKKTAKAFTPIKGFKVLESGEIIDGAGTLCRGDLDAIKKEHEKSMAKRKANLEYHRKKVEDAKDDVKFQERIIAFDNGLLKSA